MQHESESVRARCVGNGDLELEVAGELRGVYERIGEGASRFVAAVVREGEPRPVEAGSAIEAEAGLSRKAVRVADVR